MGLDVDCFGPAPRRFTNATHVFETTRPDAVESVLRRADDALRDGYYVAGYLTYEAGAALVGLAHEATSADRPLLALGAYGAPNGPATRERRVAAETARLGPLVCTISPSRYARDLARIARALHAGDAYQVNYTVPFAFGFEGDPRALFDALRPLARVPYASYVRHDARAYASLSPELFVEIDDTIVRTKPMKGTGATEAVLASEKNRAEHVMIVDLLRNDLHRICDAVDVESLFEVVRFPTFATMTTTLRGTLSRGPYLADIFGAMFPCGSITGAPKRAAMSFIDACEGAPRGIAMGTIGYAEPTRRGCWSVAIRTLDLDCATGRGSVRIGGGIVADSNAADEWAEILVKRRVFDAIAEPVALLETMRIAADGRIGRLDAHLERLERSAFALGLPFDSDSISRSIAAVVARPRVADEIVRLELATERVRVTVRPLDAMPADVRVCVALQRLRADDPLLRHKTSLRTSYDAALADASARECFDAVLLNEAGDVADGSRTTVFLRSPDGMLSTPRLADGAVAGILRAELLRSGRAVEARIAATSLATHEVYLGNGVRGLHRATFVRAGDGRATPSVPSTSNASRNVADGDVSGGGRPLARPGR